jgi:hypothetical protein
VHLLEAIRAEGLDQDAPVLGGGLEQGVFAYETQQLLLHAGHRRRALRLDIVVGALTVTLEDLLERGYFQTHVPRLSALRIGLVEPTPHFAPLDLRRVLVFTRPVQSPGPDSSVGRAVRSRGSSCRTTSTPSVVRCKSCSM